MNDNENSDFLWDEEYGNHYGADCNRQCRAHKSKDRRDLQRSQERAFEERGRSKAGQGTGCVLILAFLVGGGAGLLLLISHVLA